MTLTKIQKTSLAVIMAMGLLIAAPAAQACIDGPAGTDCVAMPMTHAFGEEKAGVYGAAMEKMHMDMGAVPATGNADIDFVNGMIPHHQGAIDMAKVLKEKGKDPMLQKMADDIIKAQESEIAVMKKWLAEQAKKPE